MWYLIAGVVLLVLIVIGVLASRGSLDPNQRAEILKARSLALFERGKIKAAIRHDEKALRIYEKISYDRACVATHIKVGRLYLADKQLDKAIEHLTISYKESQKPGYERFALESADVLGECFLQKGESRKALEYFKTSVTLENKETTEPGAGHRSVPMPVPSEIQRAFPERSRVIVPRSPIEVALRRVHAVLSKVNVARAHLELNQPSEARDALRDLHDALLKAVEEHRVWLQDVPAVGQLAAPGPYLEHLWTVLDESNESAETLSWMCRSALDARQQVAERIRGIEFGV